MSFGWQGKVACMFFIVFHMPFACGGAGWGGIRSSMFGKTKPVADTISMCSISWVGNQHMV